MTATNTITTHQKSIEEEFQSFVLKRMKPVAGSVTPEARIILAFRRACRLCRDEEVIVTNLNILRWFTTCATGNTGQISEKKNQKSARSQTSGGMPVSVHLWRCMIKVYV